MAIERTLYLSQFTFNSVTYAGGNLLGGPIRCRWEDQAEGTVEDRTGSDNLPTAVYPIDRACRLYISMRDVNAAIAPGTTGALVATLKDDTATVKTLTFGNMVYTGTTASQDRATPGEAEYVFTHESSDGTTTPIGEA